MVVSPRSAVKCILRTTRSDRERGGVRTQRGRRSPVVNEPRDFQYLGMLWEEEGMALSLLHVARYPSDQVAETSAPYQWFLPSAAATVLPAAATTATYTLDAGALSISAPTGTVPSYNQNLWIAHLSKGAAYLPS